MRPLIVSFGLFIASLIASATSIGNEVIVDGTRFTLADGVQLEKVASEPLTKWPIVADWDDQGRLVVAESGGVGRPIQEDNEQRRHRIVRLVDSDGDGHFDERIVAAEAVAFPEGVLCLGDQIFVSAPPEIWRFADTDGDGVCDQREVWFDGKTITNCANDLHGPYLGPDGWIYWCKGAFGEQTHELVDGRTLETRASHIFRRRPEGGPLEVVMSGGMDNPVGLAFTPEGETFFSSTFLQHPGDGLRDGLAHAVYGSLFGKDHSVIDGHPRTGSLMPVMTQLGPAAPSGLACLQSDVWNSELPGQPAASDGKHSGSVPEPRTLVAALFNLHKLTAHRLVAEGASYRTVDWDLVRTERVDFHPTDVIEDADGSLLLIDTGGWYDLCCPTSRIDQTTASGGIYRIIPDEADGSVVERSSIDGSQTDTAEVVSLLFDVRPWVRREASWTLKESPAGAVPSLVAILDDGARPVDERLTALWTLCRIGSPEALASLANRLDSGHPSVLRAACHAVSIHRHSAAHAAVERLLQHAEPAVRRAAAEALGRIGNEGSMATLLRATAAPEVDRHLEHSLLYALIELSRRHRSVELIELADSDRTLGAALLVLDQTGRAESVDPARLFQALNSDDARLWRTAADILAKEPGWASGAGNQLSDLRKRAERGEETAEAALRIILSAWKGEPSTQRWLESWIREAPRQRSQGQRFLADLLPAVSQQNVVPEAWVAPLGKWLAEAEPPVRAALCDRLGELEPAAGEADALVQSLTDLARQVKDPGEQLRILSALPSGTSVGNEELERLTVSSFCVGEFRADDASLLPLASKVLARAKLSERGVMELVDNVSRVSPQYLTVAIETVHRSGHEGASGRLLETLVDVPAAKTLPQDFLVQLYRRDAPRLRELAQATTDALLQPPADVQATVEETLAELGPGDPVRGLQVFRGSKAQCSACHRMGYVGRDIGPVLTRIGASRTPEALLEAILFPSARQEQSYQATGVLTLDGRVYSGLLLDETEEAIEMQLDAERRMVIPRDDIEELEPSDVSVMPSGVAELLSVQELADLMALLRSAK